MKRFLLAFLLIHQAAVLAERPINEMPMYAGNSKPFTENGSAQEREQNKLLSAHYLEVGWEKFYANDFDLAIKRFNQAWLYDPENPMIYWGFAVVMGERGKGEGSIRHLNESMMLFEKVVDQLDNDPGFLIDMAITCTTLKCMQEYAGAEETVFVDKSTKLLSQAEHLSPELPVLWLRWAEIDCASSRPDYAYNKFAKALQFKPDYYEAMNSFAWFLATYPDRKVRNGPMALELAQEALKESAENPSVLDTLAAAWAELSQFDRAIETQEMAIKLEKRTINRPDILRVMQAHLIYYKKGDAWRSHPADCLLPPRLLIDRIEKGKGVAH